MIYNFDHLGMVSCKVAASYTGSVVGMFCGLMMFIFGATGVSIGGLILLFLGVVGLIGTVTVGCDLGEHVHTIGDTIKALCGCTRRAQKLDDVEAPSRMDPFDVATPNE